MLFRLLSYAFISLTLFYTKVVTAQTPGLIYKPASSVLGRSVLDPNSDGYTSPTSAGFSGTDYGSGSELNMVPLPSVAGEPVGDLTRGSSGGATDIVSVSSNNQSCYLMYKVVNSVSYLIFRFRLGGSSTASKGYAFLIDTDGTFSGTGNNPGFEKEVVMNTGSSGNITVNTFNASGTITASSTYNIDEYSQRSVALSTIGGNADYFYDFFVPYLDLGLSSQPVRIATATIQSAGSGISGTKADYNGIDDKVYGNNAVAIGQALIAAFPATDLSTLTAGASFSNPITNAPHVNAGLTTVSTSISGTSTEADGTTIQVYRNGSVLGATVTVSSGSWTRSISSGTLADNDQITAKATASGKSESSNSNTVYVTPCTVSVPTININGRVSSSQSVSGTWSGAVTPNGSNVQIKLYTQASDGTFHLTSTSPAGSSFYVQTPVASNPGTWSYTTGLAPNAFQQENFYATAVIVSTGCESAKSNVSVKTTGTTGNVTATPEITTTSLYSSTGSTTVTVKNLEATASSLLLYLNGIQIGNTGATTYAQNGTHNFSVTGLAADDMLTARAQSATRDYWLSNISATVTVLETTSGQTNAPAITGTYTSGSGKTVSGTNGEAAETTITLYKTVSAVTTELGTATLDIYGNWSISSLTLASGDVLTAKAKASGKTLSNSSSGTTVQSSVPSAPSITAGTYTSATTSVSGTGGTGTVTVYVDGSSIGTATPSSGSWTLSGIAAGQLYRNASITATNTVSNIESAESSAVVVTGPNSFLITNTSDASIGTQVAGVAFPIKIVAKDGAGGLGSTFTAYTGKVVVSSTATFESGSGQTAAFTTGVLASHSIALRTSGANKTVSVVNSDDPTATGSATIAVIGPNTEYKLVLNAPADLSAGSRASYTVTRQDFYDNATTTGSRTIQLSASGASGVFYNAASGGSVITSITIGSGSSDANFWFYATTAGAYTITAASSGLQDGTDNITVNAAASSAISLSLSSYISRLVNVPVYAQLKDAYGNNVSTSGVTVNWSSNKGTMSAASSTTNSSGIATSNLYSTENAGVSHTVTATVSSPSITATANTIIADGKVWSGTTNSNFNTAGNWMDGSAPNSSDGVSIYFDGNATNSLQLQSNTTLNNITIDGSTSNHLLVLNGKSLTINGTITVGGTGKIQANANGDVIVMKGSSAQTIPSGTFVDNTVTALTIDNAAGVTLGGTTKVTNVLTPTSGTLTTGGYLTIRSTSSGTARVAAGSSSGGYISGEVIVERYIPAQRKWRFITSPVTGSSNNSIFYNWQNNGTTTGSTGVEIWGPGGSSDPSTNSSGLANGPLHSLRYFNNGWTNITTTKDATAHPLFSATANHAFGLYVSGPFANGSGNIASGQTATTLSAKGSLIQGTHTKTLSANPSANQFFLVGNPYASPIDQGTLTGNNLTNTLWVWDASENGTYNQGRILAFDRSNKQFSAVTTGYGSNNIRVQSGQAFFVQASVAGASTSIQFTEADKSDAVTGNMFGVHASEERNPMLRVMLQADLNGYREILDGAAAFFYKGGNAAVDHMDGMKMFHGQENIFFTRNNVGLTFEHLPLVRTADTLHLRLTNLHQTAYTLVLAGSDFKDNLLEAILVDRTENKQQNISLSDTTLYAFKVGPSTGELIDRFMVVLRKKPIPLQLFSIQVQKKGQVVEVGWNSGDEQFITRYEVLSSRDGNTFKPITVVPAMNGSVAKYTITDNHASIGMNFYMLKVFYIDSTVRYSELEMVQLDGAGSDITLYPNPAQLTAQVHVKNSKHGFYNIEIISQGGKVVRKWRRQVPKMEQFYLNLEGLSHGVYYIRLTDMNGEIRTSTFVKQ